MDVAAYHLKSELARVCLPAPDRDAYRRLAWVNSLCIFFLAVGVIGARSRLPVPERPPPIEQPIPVIIEPLATPPPSTEVKQVEPQNEDEKSLAPQVVAVTLDTPAINFSVPTIGNLLVPTAAAPAPPPVELKREAPVVQRGPTTTQNTGTSGDRPARTGYPEQAEALGQHGTVVLQFTVDDVGAVTSVTVKESSGYPLLDRDAASWIKHHWIQPPINGSHVFETRFVYKLE
jgi:TonB family protein